MRHVEISKQVEKELSKFDGKGKSWQKAIIKALEDDSNTIEDIMDTFEPLKGDLKGYRKAKNRSLGIRIVFRIIGEEKIEIFKVDNDIDDKYNEVIQVIAAGRRDKVYKTANMRAKNIKLQDDRLNRKRKRLGEKNNE